MSVQWCQFSAGNPGRSVVYHVSCPGLKLFDCLFWAELGWNKKARIVFSQKSYIFLCSCTRFYTRFGVFLFVYEIKEIKKISELGDISRTQRLWSNMRNSLYDINKVWVGGSWGSELKGGAVSIIASNQWPHITSAFSKVAPCSCYQTQGIVDNCPHVASAFQGCTVIFVI